MHAYHLQQCLHMPYVLSSWLTRSVGPTQLVGKASRFSAADWQRQCIAVACIPFAPLPACCMYHCMIQLGGRVSRVSRPNLHACHLHHQQSPPACCVECHSVRMRSANSAYSQHATDAAPRVQGASAPAVSLILLTLHHPYPCLNAPLLGKVTAPI